MKSVAIINSLPGSLGDYCSNRVAGYFNDAYNIILINAMEERFPADVALWAKERDVAAILPAGSLNSPLDDEPWIRRLEEFLRDALAAEIPMLGICFGHEVIASAFGGKLENRGEYTVATRHVRILADDPLFAGFNGETTQVVAHSVHVTEPPPGFITIGSTPDCNAQAFRHERLPVYGVQFHPEMDPEIKIHDEDWEALTDAELTDFDGPALMRNFRAIIDAKYS